MRVKRAAFVGLGVMGFPMAGHLARQGWEVNVYNRSGYKASNWVDLHKGRSFSSPRAASQHCEFVFTCVGNDDDLRSVVYGDEGVLAGLNKGATLIDHTTTSASVAREVSEVADAHGIAFLDAPVSGGQAGAENGVLTIMVGGKKETFETALPALKAYGKSITYIGDSGNGQLAKMVNQICIAGLVQALAEGLNFASHAGLDVSKVIEAISGGAAQSWQMDNRARTMLKGEFDFGFAVDWMRKDLGFCLDEAKKNGASLPITALVDEFYGDIQKKGGGRWDTSSLIENLRTN